MNTVLVAVKLEFLSCQLHVWR